MLSKFSHYYCIHCANAFRSGKQGFIFQPFKPKVVSKGRNSKESTLTVKQQVRFKPELFGAHCHNNLP